jgi:phosphoglycolate phosphatase-like HAD superfamily hydrolase
MFSLPQIDRRSKSKVPAADAYVFDIDGTLLVTRDRVHWNALRQAMLEAYGVDATIAGIQYHGMTDLSILRAALARAEIDAAAFEAALPTALAVVVREFESNRTSIELQICPGIRSLLEELRSSERLLGVASGNLERIGWHKLEAVRLRDFFGFGCFSDHCETRAGIFHHAVDHVCQALGSHAQTCFVGDTPADIRAARASGASIVAVASGIFSCEELSACSPDVCVSDCGQLFYD